MTANGFLNRRPEVRPLSGPRSALPIGSPISLVRASRDSKENLKKGFLVLDIFDIGLLARKAPACPGRGVGHRPIGQPRVSFGRRDYS